jgi:hypothetical protein
MKSNTTALWFVLAVTLAAAIWLLDNYFQPAATGEKPVFAGLRADRVTGIQIIPAGAREISVTRTNQTWLLEKPIAYPARTAAIDGLLGALEKLTPVLSLSAGEMSSHKNADAEFGFDNPQFTLDLDAGGQTWRLRVGNKTAPGDGVYVRVVGAAGALVTDTAWLQFLPHDAADWRDTALVDMPGVVDWLVITNGTQAIELRRDVTNRLWHIIWPLPARADNLRIVSALQQLRTAQVSRFVSDDPKADLTTYGLEPAALDVWLGTGTNLLTAVHAGKDVTGMPGEMFARRENWNTIVTTPKEPLAPWRGAVNDFRDKNLLELTSPVAEIEVRGDNNFTLQQHGSNGWAMVGEKFPVDPDQVTAYIRSLAGLQIVDFVQDALTASVLQKFGLATPSPQITLRSVAGDTNSVIAQLLFGAATTNEVYVKRSDEASIYGLAPGDLGQIALPGDCFRAHRVWNFSETNVAQVTLQQNGKTRQMIRTGTNDWSLAPGSQGIINPPAIEETVHRLGRLDVLFWIGRKFNDAQDIGITTNGLSLTLELKTGEKYSLEFGKNVWLPSLKTETPLAVVTLEGERWAFIFPPVLYPLVAEALTIPPDAP